MPHRPAIGLELPCERKPGTRAQLLLLSRSHILLQCTPRAGRLRGPRHVGRELASLLRTCEERLRHRLRELPPGRALLATALVTNHRTWERRVHKQYLSPHHLRVPTTERFCSFQLPVCAWPCSTACH